MVVRTFRDLKVWQKSVELVEVIYLHTKNFPKEELYGLTSQMRRASISIPSNIAEGSSRESTKEFVRFLNIAKGSLMELQTQVIIANRLGMLSENNYKFIIENAEEISRIINGLKKSLILRMNEEEREAQKNNA
jgi:four helix bundle protein